jgi:hypothetical protein
MEYLGDKRSSFTCLQSMHRSKAGWLVFVGSASGQTSVKPSCFGLSTRTTAVDLLPKNLSKIPMMW